MNQEYLTTALFLNDDFICDLHGTEDHIKTQAMNIFQLRQDVMNSIPTADKRQSGGIKFRCLGSQQENSFSGQHKSLTGWKMSSSLFPDYVFDIIIQ